MVGRREEKRWLREVRETTSDTTVIPPLWWVREREERKSECDCVQLWSRVEWQLIVFCKLSLWQFVLSGRGVDGLLCDLTPPIAFLKKKKGDQSVRYEQRLSRPSGESCDLHRGDFWRFGESEHHIFLLFNNVKSVLQPGWSLTHMRQEESSESEWIKQVHYGKCWIKEVRISRPLQLWF